MKKIHHIQPVPRPQLSTLLKRSEDLIRRSRQAIKALEELKSQTSKVDKNIDQNRETKLTSIPDTN